MLGNPCPIDDLKSAPLLDLDFSLVTDAGIAGLLASVYSGRFKGHYIS